MYSKLCTTLMEKEKSLSMINKFKPTMTVFAGTNGAGKSTLSMQIRHTLGELVDPDQIARELKPEDPRSADLSAGKEAVKRTRSLIKQEKSFAVETTLSGTFILKHMQIAKQNNYEILMYYIGLQDIQMHIDRVASRVEQGGHWISEEDIRWRYGQSLQNLKPAAEIADQVIVIDNTYDLTVVAEIVQHHMVYCLNKLPAWSVDFISEYA